MNKLTKKIIWYVVIVLLIFLIGWWIYNQFPKGMDYSQSFPDQGREHIDIGAEHQEYNSNPPTSGSHYAQSAKEGFYEKELPDEQLVHNLEHGDIWIAYKPELSKEIIKQLKSFAGFMVIVAPRAKNDMDIALAGWGRLDKFNLENGVLNAQRVRDFILRYQNKGPEKLNMVR